MIRASILLSALVLVSGLVATGIAMANSSSSSRSTTGQIGVNVPNQVCASGSMSDPQDCHLPNRQGKRSLDPHAR